VEYAVRSLHVAHIVVLGHSGCGGVRGCHDMCEGRAPELLEATSFVGRWMDILRPGFEALAPGAEAERLRALEKAAVTVSLDNLLSFPFVREAVEGELLSLHGLWHDIGEGRLEAWDEGRGVFVPI
jgi:carbonic anhydrase